MLRSNRLLLLVALLAFPTGLLLWPTLGYRSALPLQAETLTLPKRETLSAPEPPKNGTRGPSALAFSPDGKTLYMTEQDENVVTLLEPDTEKVLARIPSGGQQPTALAFSPDGKTLVVSNTFSGDIGLIDVASRTLRSQIPLRGMPRGVVVSPDGKAFVAVSQLHEIAVIDLNTAKVTGRLPTGQQPRALAIYAREERAACVSMDGTLTLLDTKFGKEVTRLKLPAVNLRGVAFSPDGKRILVTGQQPHNEPPTEKPEAMWTNQLFTVWRDGDTLKLERVLTLDTETDGAADPWDVVTDGEKAYLSIAGTHEVYVVAAQAGGKIETEARSGRRIPVGTNPRALARRPHSAELWVADHLGNTLHILPTGGTQLAATGSAGRVIALEPPTPSPARRLRGRFFFSSAHITRGGKFTCETCHPDVGSDGLSWKFAHVKDKIGARTTRDLRGNLLLTSPYGWGGRVEDFEDFVQEEVMGLLKTRKLSHDDVHALWDLVNETPLPPNPYRNTDSTFTDAALRGKALFYGQADCISCHKGAQSGGTSKKEWIGTTPKGLKLDVPHLEAVYDGAPYLHDGRAETLEDIFTKHNAAQKHGKAHLLTPEQMRDMLAYLREL